jgi:hypothetical protein
MLYSDLAGADMAAPVRLRGGAERQGVVRGGRRGQGQQESTIAGRRARGIKRGQVGRN